MQDLHPYTGKMMGIRLMMKAGYPFRRNDLTVEEWEDLGRLQDLLSESHDKMPRPVYLVKITGDL